MALTTHTSLDSNLREGNSPSRCNC